MSYDATCNPYTSQAERDAAIKAERERESMARRLVGGMAFGIVATNRVQAALEKRHGMGPRKVATA